MEMSDQSLHFLPFHLHILDTFLSPVVRSIVKMLSLTNSLRGQLITTLLLNILKFFVEKMREAFALQKLLTFFLQKILAYLRN